MQKTSFYRRYLGSAGTALLPLVFFWQLHLPMGTFAQDPIKDTVYQSSAFTIEWTGQFPSTDRKQAKKPFGKRLKELITGRDDAGIMGKPVDMVPMAEGEVCILDQGSQQIVQSNDGLGEMTQFRGSEYRFFPSLVGICPFIDGKFLFTDSYYNKVFIFTPGSKELGVLNDTLLFDRPTGIAYCHVNQQVWIVETNAHRVVALNKEGQVIRKIGGRGTAPGRFNFPTSVWIDDFGKVFIVDAMNYRIQIFSADGEYISQFGKPGDGSGHLARPKGIATDSFGNVYVVDALFNTVQIFDGKGNFLYNFGAQGRGRGEFWMPSGIYIDEADNIYVADTYNARIQVFRLKKRE